MPRKRTRKANRKAKDSVFVDLFHQKKYCLQLFKSLHPEMDVTSSDIKTITLKHIVVDRQYNDLGILVQDKLIILIEAQSKWSDNILLRLWFYASDTYLTQIKNNPAWDVHDTKAIPLPPPEFVVIYTGNRDIPPTVSLREHFFKNANVPIDLIAKVIRQEGNDIIGQYITFCHVFDDMVKNYGQTRKAVEETIRICRDKGVLAEYLRDREEEVIEAMVMLFDQQTAVEQYGDRREAEGEAKATAAATERDKRRVLKLFAKGNSPEEIADDMELDLKLVKEWLAAPSMA
ncbi:MAG: hypothetical protein IJ646_08440 [Clostridia bacterium]|nr:hypothetical protein [Clostridia bacterium]